MSFSNKAAVLLFISVLTLSVFMAPIGQVSRAEVASSPGLSPAAQEQIDNWYETMAQPGFSPEIDSTLASWVETGIVTDQMVTTDRGVSAIVITTTDVSMDAIRNVVSVDYFVNLGYFQTLKVTMSGPEAVNKLAKIDGVGIIDADLWRFPIGDDLVKEIDIAPNIPSEGVDMDFIYDTVGADSGAANNYDGTGITVGHVDTGADFGNPALQAAYNTGSYDGTGEGITPMWYYANSSFVSNVTDWVDVEGNLLTYIDGNGDVMLNVTGWDPVLRNSVFGQRSLYGGFIDIYDYWWLQVYGFAGTNMTWLETTKNDWKLPDTGNLSTGTDYQVNWIFQQQSGPYAKLFAPALVYNSSVDKTYDLMINWDDADAWNYMWTAAYYWNSINVSHSSAGDMADIYNKFDWNFQDEFAEGEIYDMSNPIVAYNYDGVGLDDFSLGSLCWAYDAFDITDDVIFEGFSENGDFALYWDDGSHGTATAIHVVGRDVASDWYDESNDRYVNMTGIAPGADMISVRALSGGSDYFSYLWLAGFDMLNETSGEFNYTGNHMADLVTNSWGWITEPASQMNYLSFTWEILSTPGLLETGYPGVLHVFSAGNEGSGYMTIGPPGAATSVLTVGASTTSHWLDYLYGPTQPYEGMASFSSRGPSFTGYPKPDVLAPGLAGYSGVPWYSDYYGDSWGSTANTTLFAGTSQAAPIAAGVAALVMDALNFDSSNGDNPFIVKTIIQSTAKDLGYDAAIQGFGRVDANSACTFVEVNGLIGATTDSAYNFAQFIGDSWAYWGILPSSYVPRDVNSTTVGFPDSNYDGALFFGQLMPGDSATITYSIYTVSTDMFATPDNGVYTGATPSFMNMTDMFTFNNVTFSYNDTNLAGEQMYGWYDFSDQLSGPDYTSVTNADMIQIVVSFDAGDVGGAEPWMFLYDWNDVSTDGMPNLYNMTTGNYDELHRLTSASDDSNINLMQWVPEALSGVLTLVVHDPAHDVATDWWNATATPGNDFTVTIITYTAEDPGVFSFAEEGTATGSVNVSLTVPGGADPGIYTGFINFAGNLKVPYSYTVVYNLTLDGGDVNTLFTDYGADLTPYDNVLYGAMDEDPDDWDFRSYVLYNPYATAEYIGIRAEFADAGSDMYIAIYDSENMELAYGSALTDTSTAVIAELDGMGYYYLLVHPIALNGTIAQPVEFTLEAMLYDALTDQPVVLSYTSDDRAGTTPVVDGDTLWGDHVVLNASFPAFNLPNMPEYEIVSTTFGFLSGVYHQNSGDNVIPDSSYDPFSGPVDLTQFAWDFVEGIGEGDTVDIEVDFTNGDNDIMVWWADTDNTTWSYGNNLVGAQMATGAHPEVGQFTAGRDGTLAIGIFDYDLAAGTWTVTVDTRVGEYETAAGPEVTYDTYDFDRNGTFQVQLSAETETNLDFEINLVALTFNNFFTPSVDTVDVTGSGAVKTIIWTFSDLNAQDNHTFEVLLSGDAGDTFQLIATGLTALTYDWDSTGFTEKNYVVKIRAEDSYGLDDELDSASFAAGTVPPPTTTTTTTPPSTTTTPPFVIDPLWIGLIGGIGVGVVVILILFLVRKK